MIKRGAEHVVSGLGRIAADFTGITDSVRFASRHVADTSGSVSDRIATGFVGALIGIIHPFVPLAVARMNRAFNPDVMDNKPRVWGAISDTATILTCFGLDIATNAAIVAMPPLGFLAKGLQMGGLAVIRGVADEVRGEDLAY